MPGVVAVYTASDLDCPTPRLHDAAADDEPAAARAATRCGSSATSSRWSSPRRRRRRSTRPRAVIVDYDPLPAVVDRRGRARRRRAGHARGAGFERRQRDGHRPGRRRARRRRRRRRGSASSTSGSPRCRWSRPASSPFPASRRAGSRSGSRTQGPHGVRDEIAMHARARPRGRPRRATPRSAAASARSRA